MAPSKHKKNQFLLPRLIFFILISFLFLSCEINQKEHKGIISLTPAISSILFDLGIDKEVIAVTSNDEFILETSVGSFIHFSLEKILSLYPKTVIYQDFQEEWIKPILNHPKIQFIKVSLNNLNSIFQAAQKIGKTFGLKNEALPNPGFILPLTQELKLKPFRYLAVVDRDREWKTVFAAGKSSYLAELLDFLGGTNLLNSERDYIQVSEEIFLLKEKPDIIICFTNRIDNETFYKNIPVIYLSNPKLSIPDLKIESKLRLIQKEIRFILNP
ncbi:MAG TPA: hypothetical protein DHW82_10125 [Spirochaetia bacterium]|nr:MAG: hypothetical protein A2Y41_14190 [Spirochaetes bacterium GWB1_36_13]HCL57347.1 hypothetical protein [Spirochaetia bacterium]